MKARISWTILLVGFALMLAHNHADYLLQAYQHGWATWWDLHGRAADWPWYLDVLPRDAWHGVQNMRNHTIIVASALIYAECEAYAFWTMNLRYWWHRFALSLFVTLLCYGLARAVAFSLVKAIMN